MRYIDIGKRVFDTEIDALKKTRNELNETFEKILELIVKCTGKVVLLGMGKSGHVARKIAATFSSLGTPSFYIHPGEAMHGDLGMISNDDIVIAISYSGQSDEIIKILPNIKMIGAVIIGITGNIDSVIAKVADIVQVLPQFNEACNLGLAPTSSTTAVLCYGDALAVAASKIYGFSDSDFGKFHPAGMLGKKLILKVNDLMSKDDELPKVYLKTLLISAIAVMSQKGLGVVAVTDKNNKLMGILTDGDLRRIIEKHIDVYTVKVEEVMTKNPKSIEKNKLAVDALYYIKNNGINNLPVIKEDNTVIGMITWQQIIKAGIII